MRDVKTAYVQYEPSDKAYEYAHHIVGNINKYSQKGFMGKTMGLVDRDCNVVAISVERPSIGVIEVVGFLFLLTVATSFVFGVLGWWVLWFLPFMAFEWFLSRSFLAFMIIYGFEKKAKTKARRVYAEDLLAGLKNGSV